MLDPELERAITARIRDAPFARWSGIELVALGDGEGRLRLAVQPHHLNPAGLVHGGIIASLVDGAIGLALRTRLGLSARHVTLELHVNYLKPARGGTLEASGTAVHSGARTGYGEATVSDARGSVVARGSATFLVLGEGEELSAHGTEGPGAP